MDIVLTEEQALLRESLGKLLQDRYEFSTRQAISRREPGFDRNMWQQFAGMGLFAAPFGEDCGGLGLGPVGAMVIAEEFGRRLVVEPFIETAVVSGGLIELAGTPEQRATYLPGIFSGDQIWAFAATEARTRGDYSRPQARAARTANGYKLEGAKAAVLGAPWADKLIVSAHVGDDPEDLGFFVVDRTAQNLRLSNFRTIDGRRAAEISLEGVLVAENARLGDGKSSLDSFERCRERAIAALCAEAVGAMSELVRVTVDYAKTRKQFGVAIGSFQVLQHRMVDMFVASQEALAITCLLTSTLAREAGAQAALASATKAKVGEAARFVGEQAIQVHGGMGMTDELSVGHYAKRLAAIDIQFGNVEFHQARFEHTVVAA